MRRTWRGCYRAGACAKRWSRLIPLQQRKWIIVWLALNKAGSLVHKDNLKGRMWRRGKTTLCPRHDATSMRDVNSISTTMVIQPNNAEKQHKASGFVLAVSRKCMRGLIIICLLLQIKTWEWVPTWIESEVIIFSYFSYSHSESKMMVRVWMASKPKDVKKFKKALKEWENEHGGSNKIL